MSDSAKDLSARIKAGELSVRAAAKESLHRAAAADDDIQLNIFLARTHRLAVERAARLDADAEMRENAPLYGVPYAVKDNIAVSGVQLSCASRILDGYISPYTATVVERMNAAGAIVIGKTNLDEFAMGSSTENSAFGPTRNPLAPHLVPGGSSGGSAAAVAAGVVPIALGSETGGSVRQPAAFCGVVGVKPTYGRVSRHGLVAFGSSLDQVGVFATNIVDAASVLGVIAGRDDRDATSVDLSVPDFVPPATTSLKGVVIGKPREYFPDDLDIRIADLCAASLERLRSLGAEVRDVSMPHTALAIQAYYIIAPAEASSNLARFDGVRFGRRVEGDGTRGLYHATRSSGFGAEVTRRIVLGTYVLSAGFYDAYYRKAMHVRSLIAGDFSRVFASGVHALFTPTTPTPAFAIGAKSDPYDMYLSDIFTCTANLAGVPALSLPIGRTGGLPVGGQLMCAHFDEARMFAIASALEHSLGQDARR
ncbi:MAG TPA: Asp-tRNA(Asn)/Glu-tRNA(Gln) amidotransferase subunit GatA [Gemmatimonadaceae bacterium]|nr:Asp-tRNA(Asn)/Glu-tRNA(Gln) amidotransferase subunit GatA [Gemmatimonadaceae bacterium]